MPGHKLALSDHYVDIEFEEEDPYNPGYYYYSDVFGYNFSGAGSQPIDWYYVASGFSNTRPDESIHLGDTNVALDPITASHPVNLRKTLGYATVSGTLYFEYDWSSSTGGSNKSDLLNCSISEFVRYPGTGPVFTWQGPPFFDEGSTTAAVVTDNPTVSNPPLPANYSYGIQDEQRHGGDMHGPYSTLNPAFIAYQKWGYSCSNVNNGAWVYMTKETPIVRSITQNASGSWRYTVTKSGVSGGLNPLP